MIQIGPYFTTKEMVSSLFHKHTAILAFQAYIFRPNKWEFYRYNQLRYHGQAGTPKDCAVFNIEGLEYKCCLNGE